VGSSDVTVRYARSGADDVAWSDVGDGPPVLVGGWWMSHLERDWAYPPFRAFADLLARHRRVIRYDPPGTGLSRSRAEMPAAIGPHVDATVAVLDAAGVDRVTVLAGSSGVPVAVELAARHPDRVRRLVLCGAYLGGGAIASPADRDALVELVRRSWGVSSRVMSDIFFPDATPAQRAAYVRHQRSTASPDAAAAGLAAVYAFDAREAAGRVTAPTLVLHRRGDRAIALTHGRDTAERIPGAAFEILDGTAHHPWHGDGLAIARRALAFDGVPEEALPAPSSAASRAASDDDGGPGSPGRLTAREREVLLLVSQGKTDAQIAAELFLSPHTVHRHVANARTKLGVPSRAAAAAWVVGRGRA
jgi:pimeloyl-ACP methyl ester carboxylesterase/DNA-binding CsgD family transcriptional regulator